MPLDKAYWGADILFHYRRFEALMLALQNDSYPTYLDYGAAMEFGYATKWFYPDFILVPFAWLGNVTNIYFGYKSMIFCFTFLCGLITYKSAQKILNNNYISILTALLYTFAFYHIINLFSRSAIAEGIAMTFLPLIFWGLYEIIKGNYKKWYIISIGFLLLLMTHLLTSVLTFILVLIILVVYYKDLYKTPKRLYYLILAGIFSFLISAVYILPMLEQMYSNTYWFNNPHPTTWPEHNGLSILQIISGFFNGFSLSAEGQLVSIGIMLIGIILLRLFIYERTAILKKVDLLVISGFILIFLTSNLFPWGVFPFNKIKFFQFPWRLFTYISLFFALGGSYYLYILAKSNCRKYIYFSVIIVGIFFMLIINGRVFQEGKYFEETGVYTLNPEEKNYYHLGSMEYIPSKFPSLEYIKDRAGIIVTNHTDTKISDFGREYGTTKFNINIAGNEETAEIPRFYYKGYTATLNGENIPIEQSDKGLIKLTIKESGKVIITYSGTILQKISIYISIISFIILCIFIVRFKKKENA